MALIEVVPGFLIIWRLRGLLGTLAATAGAMSSASRLVLRFVGCGGDLGLVVVAGEAVDASLDTLYYAVLRGSRPLTWTAFLVPVKPSC